MSGTAFQRRGSRLSAEPRLGVGLGERDWRWRGAPLAVPGVLSTELGVLSGASCRLDTGVEGIFDSFARRFPFLASANSFSYVRQNEHNFHAELPVALEKCVIVKDVSLGALHRS